MFRDVFESSGRLWLKPYWNSSAVQGVFSFRMGGVSLLPYKSLNMGFHVGDDEASVVLNRRICADVLAGELNTWVVAEQVHGHEVAHVCAAERGCGAFSSKDAIKGVDALVTNDSNITLAVLSADCVPILFYDPVRTVIGTAHSGWKGTLAHITVEVLKVMQEQYGSNPAEIQVSLGPSIRRCCYEVNPSVAMPMMKMFGTQVACKRFGKPGHWLLSLQDCIRHDLLTHGIKLEHIHDCGICTGCHVSMLFSHRMEGGRTGRFIGAIRLNSNKK